MKHLAMAICIGLVSHTGAAHVSGGRAPIPPRVEFRALHASELHLGMSPSEVSQIMGPATEVRQMGEYQTLDFLAEPIPTRVYFTASKVSRIALDIARANDEHLPAFTQQAVVGMDRTGVRNRLGDPTRSRHFEFFGIRLEQWIFERRGQAIASVFFVEDRVVRKTRGTAVPVDVFTVLLPAEQNLPTVRPPGDRVVIVPPPDDRVAIGASAGDIQQAFGPPTLEVTYRYDGLPAAHLLYQTRNHHTLSAYYVAGVLTEIEDAGAWSVDDTSAG